MWLLEELESLTELGDLHSMDLARNNTNDVRKLHQEVKKKEWDISLVDSSQGLDTEERDFCKLQSLHWFYLTPSENYKKSRNAAADDTVFKIPGFRDIPRRTERATF